MKQTAWLLAGNAALAAVYVLAGQFGLSIASIHASASAVWPPTGIALAALLIWGWRLWPGVFVGALAVNLGVPGAALAAPGIALGNTLEAVVGALLVRRYAGGCRAFERTLTFFRFVFFGAFVSTMLSPATGVTTLCLTGSANWDQYGAIWLTWWLGDMTSNLTIAPMLVIWLTQGLPRLDLRRSGEAAGVLAAIALVGSFLFLGPGAYAGQTCHALTYLAIPPLLWAGFRFGERGAVAGVLLTAALALRGTLTDRGPFIAASPNESLLFLQAFVGTIAITSLALALAASERRKAEAQMRLQAVALESAANAIIITDRDGRIEWVNDAFGRLTGYRADEALGRSPRFLNSGRHPREFFRGMWDTVLSGRVWHGEVVNRRKDGTLYTEEMTVTPVLNGRGERTHFIAIKQDVTARKQAEQALREVREDLAQSNARLEDLVSERTAKLRESVAELEHFSYSIVHDLRAPLRAIQGYGAIIAERAGGILPPESREYLARMQTAVIRMDQLIIDALSFSKAVLGELPLRPVDIETLLRGMLQSYPEFEQARADIVLKGDFPAVLGNEAGLTQCFSNLLNNAVKFVKPGTRPRILIRTERRDAFVRVWVEDNGIGIPPEGLRRIFGMFQRMHGAEYEGTGIGLALVRKVMERMGGRIGVESEPDRGSRFWIELPAADTEGGPGVCQTGAAGGAVAPESSRAAAIGP